MLTCLGLMAFGAAFLLAGYPAWLGPAVIPAMVAIAIAYLAVKRASPGA